MLKLSQLSKFDNAQEKWRSLEKDKRVMFIGFGKTYPARFAVPRIKVI